MIGLVILNYRGPSNVLRLLEDLGACKRPGVPVRAYVVDNASGDDSPTLLMEAATRDASIAVILSERNEGYGPGNNLGIKAAVDDDCALIVVLNPDVGIADENFLVNCWKVAQEQPSTVAIISPRIMEPTGEAHADVGVMNGATGRFGESLKSAGPLGPNEYPLGCSLLIRGEYARGVVGKVFREHLFLYAEEFFLKLDVERRGFFCSSTPDIRVVHEGMASTETSSVSFRFRRRLADRNLLWYARERHGRLYEAWLSLWVLMRGLVRVVRQRDLDEARVAVQSVYGAWTELNHSAQ